MSGTSTSPAAGWYPDPGGTAGLRWWDGVAWTTALRSDPVPVMDPVPVVHAAPAYAGDARFGGVAPGVPSAVAPALAPTHRAHASAAAHRASGLPWWGVAVAAALLIGAVLVGVKLLARGGGDPTLTATAAGPTTGTAGGVAQAAALEADVRNVAVAEETVYTERQAYVAATSVGAALTVGDQAVRVSVPGETVTVVLNGRHDAYCVVARRTPRGGGPQQAAVYVSNDGGVQPRAVTACPAGF